MTRINVIPVEILTDNFLMAEYYELPRMWPLIYRAIQKDDRDIPETYRLGTGHLRFFYNKENYLYKRYNALENEGTRRKLDLQKDSAITINWFDIAELGADPFWYQDYTPTAEAIQLNLDRLQLRRRYDGGLYQGSR